MRLFFLISIIFAQSEIQHLNQAIYIRTTEKKYVKYNFKYIYFLAITLHALSMHYLNLGL